MRLPTWRHRPEPASATTPGVTGGGLRPKSGEPVGAALSIEHLTKSFESWNGTTTTALQGINIDIAPAEFVCVIGPSGCGKSTLLNILAGFEKPTTGQVRMDGRPLGPPSAERSVIFQDVQGSLMPWLTSLENVELGLRLAGYGGAEKRETAVSALESVGLGLALDKYPFELSGGMQQRVQIARALALAPRLLLMDEPYGALDYLTRTALQRQLETIYLARGFSVVLVTHDITEAVLMSDTIWVMDAGLIKEAIHLDCARPRDLGDPEVSRVIRHLRGELLQDKEGSRRPDRAAASETGERSERSR